MLTLNNVMQTTDNYFADHLKGSKKAVLDSTYESIESSIIWLRKELVANGYKITVIVKNDSLTVIHKLYGYEKIEQFLKGHEGDVKEMTVLRDFMSDELNKDGAVA